MLVIQLVKKFPAFMGHVGSSPHSQKAAIGPIPEPLISGPHFHTRYF